MNRTANTFIGIAIAIILPAFAYYTAITLVPSTTYGNEFVTFGRALAGTVIALLALAGIAALRHIASLAYGLAAGAGFTLLGTITALTSLSDTAVQGLAGTVLLAIFALCGGMAWGYDKMFKASEAEHPQSHVTPPASPVN